MIDNKFFDVNMIVGRRAKCYPGSFYETETLEKKMAQYGIERGLVYHNYAREDDPGKGNQRLLEITKNSDKLYPVFVALPHHTYPEFRPDRFYETLKENKVRAVKIFPSPDFHGFLVTKPVCGELFEMLEANKIPLLVGFNQLDLNAVYNITQDFKDLKIVITDYTYRQDRNMYALMDKMPNVYIETIGYKTFTGIEAFVKTFGSERLVFGSGMPFYSGASAVSMINYADLSEHDKENIAYRNLDRILSEVSYLGGEA